jgi:hypothetical protein
MRAAPLAALVLAAAGCVVTRPPFTHERPLWRITSGDSFEAGCAIGRAFIRKSGKAGFGVALQWRSRGDCRVAIEAVRLRLAHRELTAAPPGTGAAAKLAVVPLAAVELPGRSLVYAWLPVQFDNDAAWNDGRDHGLLELDVAVAGAPATPWRIPVHQRIPERLEEGGRP